MFGRKVNDFINEKMMHGTTCNHESSSTTGEDIQTNADDSKPSQSNSQDSQNVRYDKGNEKKRIASPDERRNDCKNKQACLNHSSLNSAESNSTVFETVACPDRNVGKVLDRKSSSLSLGSDFPGGSERKSEQSYSSTSTDGPWSSLFTDNCVDSIMMPARHPLWKNTSAFLERGKQGNFSSTSESTKGSDSTTTKNEISSTAIRRSGKEQSVITNNVENRCAPAPSSTNVDDKKTGSNCIMNNYAAEVIQRNEIPTITKRNTKEILDNPTINTLPDIDQHIKTKKVSNLPILRQPAQTPNRNVHAGTSAGQFTEGSTNLLGSSPSILPAPYCAMYPFSLSAPHQRFGMIDNTRYQGQAVPNNPTIDASSDPKYLVNTSSALLCGPNMPISKFLIQGSLVSPSQQQSMLSSVVVRSHNSLTGAGAVQVGPQELSSAMLMISGQGNNHNIVEAQDDTMARTSGIITTKGPRMLVKTLHLQCDYDYLSEYQILVRKQLEVFEADAKDVGTKIQGRKGTISIGQVGLRCQHCTTLPLLDRGRGSVYYPMKLSGLYPAAQNMAVSHLHRSCPCIPPSIREELIRLHNSKNRASGGKEYWADAGKAFGLFESSDAGIGWASQAVPTKINK